MRGSSLSLSSALVLVRRTSITDSIGGSLWYDMRYSNDYLRKRLSFEARQKVVYGVIDEVEGALLTHIKLRGGRRLLEKLFDILHEFIVVEGDTYCMLKLF